MKKLLRTLGVAGALASLGVLLARQALPFELLSHFPVQFVAALAPMALLLFLVKEKAAGFFVALVAFFHFAHVAPDFAQFEPSAEGSSGARLKVVSFNIHTSNHAFDQVNAFLKEEKPDVLLITELGADAARNLDFASLGLKPVEEVAREDNFGIGLYSRFPVKSSRISYPGGVTTPAVEAAIAVPSQAGEVILNLTGLHPIPPVSGASLTRRNAQLFAAGEAAARTDGAVLLLGDFNLTPWSPYFDDLLAISKLADSRKVGGGGLQTSWPTWSPVLAIPIDHALVSRHVKVLVRRIGPDVGSDHYPVILNLAL